MSYPHHLTLCIDEELLDERYRGYHARQLAASRQVEDAPAPRADFWHRFILWPLGLGFMAAGLGWGLYMIAASVVA